jgi:hypothetical protein
MFGTYPSKVWSKWITFQRSHKKRNHWGMRAGEVLENPHYMERRHYEERMRVEDQARAAAANR